MRVFASKLRAAASRSLTLCLGIAGAGLIAYGAYLVYPPAAFIIGGIIVLFAGWDSAN